MSSLHANWGWVTVAITGLVGLWGLLLAWRGHDPTRSFWVGVGVAMGVTIIQVALGVFLVAGEGREGGDQHVFYGFVIAFTLAFAYIYRAQLARKPALYYSALLLFVMGLALRTIATAGVDF
ncbi:MAG TPA: hypothetical protein VK070_03940 [Acidimicrobiia bacterium]|nr:hypothetical protein [Acidimicrobiia bacterium]